MRYFFYFLLLPVPWYCFSQNSCNITTKIDQFNKNIKGRTQYFMFEREYGQLWCTASRDGSHMTVVFNLQPSRGSTSVYCFDKGSKAIILFKDETQTVAYNDDDGISCEGDFYLTATVSNKTFVNHRSLFDKLSTKPIKAIRFYTTEGYIDAEMVKGAEGTGSTSEDFSFQLKCLKNLK